MILGQVADDRTRKGMVKINAVVDSGAEANALPENMMQWIHLKPSSASKSGKIFRGARGDPIPARGERSVTGPTEEGQSRRMVLEVQSAWRGQGLRQEQQDGADHKPPSRAQRVDA